jgi:hypothetical protein
MIKNPFVKSFEEQINSAVSIFQATKTKLETINASMSAEIANNQTKIDELLAANQTMKKLSKDNDVVVANINKIFEPAIPDDLFIPESIVETPLFVFDAETLKEVYDLSKRMSEENIEWRSGQAYFNALHQIAPGVANKIRGGEFDCYHNDSLIPKLIEHLRETYL